MTNKPINRKFGLVTGIACLIFNICLAVFKHSTNMLPGATGLILLLAALTVPDFLNPIRIVWNKIGEILGLLNTTIILSIMFFLIITPISILLRLFKKRAIETEWQEQKISYWQPSEQYEKGSYKQQF
ncbi:SxtJ family membrane protein [Mucilaginibacter paludis]|uniref:Uncharacterized protein n=1 Tax=Mucilaginibacter paludis DSM 18603 TaxID=714943 RepID=H1Y372_9SPHI|nr:SxtJ family membrane protein [Mucilaginibacter paludis]EHQ28890.1 hypothetical protein Mucpa_4805 [Mucilaginibacter paludis DSM 18603]